ncbi:hypothetical protein PUN28_000252 [Cardiocondyla obscurior]|uniref:Uncharacterized protein n=1 Tax=Cardiocondyla obscurior TaxID=286306 RepID=A0AAW2GYD6_9HYME
MFSNQRKIARYSEYKLLFLIWYRVSSIYGTRRSVLSTRRHSRMIYFFGRVSGIYYSRFYSQLFILLKSIKELNNSFAAIVRSGCFYRRHYFFLFFFFFFFFFFFTIINVVVSLRYVLRLTGIELKIETHYGFR